MYSTAPIFFFLVIMYHINTGNACLSWTDKHAYHINKSACLSNCFLLNGTEIRIYKAYIIRPSLYTDQVYIHLNLKKIPIILSDAENKNSVQSGFDTQCNYQILS